VTAAPAGRRAPALLALGLSRHYGPHAALDRIDLEIPAGEFVALLGPNGAGKSTLLRLFATLIRPTAGRLEVHGLDPRRAERAPLARRIGLLSHQTFLYDHLTGLENLLFYARLYGLPDAPGAARAALRAVGLEDRGSDLLRTYSRGMQQRLAIARTLLHDPDIVLLDEPFTGLDPEASDRLHERLGGARAAGATCVMATHDLGAGLRLADRVVVLVSGRLVADRPAREIDAPSLGALVRQTAREPGAAREPDAAWSAP